MTNNKMPSRLSNGNKVFGKPIFQANEGYTTSVSGNGAYWPLDDTFDGTSTPSLFNADSVDSVGTVSGVIASNNPDAYSKLARKFNGLPESCLTIPTTKCLTDPSTCSSTGLSLSIWVKIANTFNVEKQYIVDAGGLEMGTAGVAIYFTNSRSGNTHNLAVTVVVNDGTQYWKVVMSGMLKPSDWNNIGLIWNPNVHTDNQTFGLKAYVNQVQTAWKRVSHKLLTAQTSSPYDRFTVGCGQNGTKSAPIYVAHLAVWYQATNSDKLMGGIKYSGNPYPCKDSNIDNCNLGSASQYVLPIDPAQACDGYRCEQLKPYQEDTSIAIDGDCSPSDPQGWGGKSPIICADTRNEIQNAVEYSTKNILAIDMAQAVIRTVLRAGPSGVSIPDLYYIGTQFVNYAMSTVNLTEFHNQVTRTGPYLDVVHIQSKLSEALYANTWNTLENEKQGPGLSWVTDLLDQWLIEVAKKSPDSGGYVRESNHTIIAIAASKEGEVSTSFIFPYYADQNNFDFYMHRPSWGVVSDYIMLPRNAFFAWNGSDLPMAFVGKLYNRYHLNLPAYTDSRVSGLDSTKFFINSRILSLTIYPPVPDFPQLLANNSVTFRVEHQTKQDDRPFLKAAVLCVSWNYNDESTKIGAWDTRGCQLITTNDSHSTCACSHTTDYAILMEERTISCVIYYIAYALLIVSILTLLLYNGFYVVSSQLHSELYFMYVNVAVGVFFGLVFYGFGLFFKGPMPRIVLSVLTQYSFTSAYLWQLFSALYLLRASRNDALKQMTVYYVLAGWSIPAVLVAVMVGIKVYYYGIGGRNLPSIGYYFLDISIGVYLTFELIALIVLIYAFVKSRSAQLLNPEDIHDLKAAVLGQFIFCILVSANWLMIVFIYIVPINSPFFDVLFEYLNAMQGIFLFCLYGLILPSFRTSLKNKEREPPFAPPAPPPDPEDDEDGNNFESVSEKQQLTGDRAFTPYDVSDDKEQNYMPPPVV